MKTEAELLKLAHDMRLNPTEPEKRLWRNLSNGQLAGLKFRRQHVIVKAQAIIDFFCPTIALCVEVDGDNHDNLVDAVRDQRLKTLGFHVERFSNADIMANIGGVAERLAASAASLPQRWDALHSPTPTPPLKGRGF